MLRVLSIETNSPVVVLSTLGKGKIVATIFVVAILASSAFLVWWYYGATIGKYDEAPQVNVIDVTILYNDTLRITEIINPSMDINKFRIDLFINGSIICWNISSSNGLSFLFEHDSTHYVFEFHDLNSNGKIDSYEYFELHVTGGFIPQTEYIVNFVYEAADWEKMVKSQQIWT